MWPVSLSNSLGHLRKYLHPWPWCREQCTADITGDLDRDRDRDDSECSLVTGDSSWLSWPGCLVTWAHDAPMVGQWDSGRGQQQVKQLPRGALHPGRRVQCKSLVMLQWGLCAVWSWDTCYLVYTRLGYFTESANEPSKYEHLMKIVSRFRKNPQTFYYMIRFLKKKILRWADEHHWCSWCCMYGGRVQCNVSKQCSKPGRESTGVQAVGERIQLRNFPLPCVSWAAEHWGVLTPDTELWLNSGERSQWDDSNGYSYNINWDSSVLMHFSSRERFLCKGGTGYWVFLRVNINCPEKGAGAALSCLAWSEPGQSCQVPDSSDLT